jgi:hypothetical protein
MPELEAVRPSGEEMDGPTFKVGPSADGRSNRMADTTLTNLTDIADRLPAARKAISPGQHAVLDYGVASFYLGLAAKYRDQHRAASGLALTNGLMVLGLAMMTDYPGGVFRTLSFKMHRTMDWIQAGVAGFGPVLLGFAGDPEARPFYSQAMSEVGVIAATDWDAQPTTA